MNGSEELQLPNTATTLPSTKIFCASETYTFVVGPIADLAVEDGGASPHVAAGRNALTIVAVNNGPDEPSGGATVTGLPTGAGVLHISHGAYDDTAGEWNIDRLRVRDYYLSGGDIRTNPGPERFRRRQRKR